MLPSLTSSRPSLLFAALISLAACSAGTEPTTNAFLGDTVAVAGDLRETASAALSPERAAVDVMLLLMNRGAQPETLTTSPSSRCGGPVIVRAWRDVNGRKSLAWNSSSMPVIPCPVALLSPLIVIAPHSAVPLSREVGNVEILGDSLPAGIYIFTASADVQSPSLPAQISTPALFVGPHYIVPPGTVLDGTWSGQADGIQLDLPLHWTADSVTATGSYLVFTPNTNRCGGGTLRGSGSVTLSASRIEDRIIGHMSFDNGWTPPYDAVQTGAALLDGHFMSVDAGPCPMPLARQVP